MVPQLPVLDSVGLFCAFRFTPVKFGHRRRVVICRVVAKTHVVWSSSELCASSRQPATGTDRSCINCGQCSFVHTGCSALRCVALRSLAVCCRVLRRKRANNVTVATNLHSACVVMNTFIRQTRQRDRQRDRLYNNRATQ